LAAKRAKLGLQARFKAIAEELAGFYLAEVIPETSEYYYESKVIPETSE
jgi:hypothetical protein